MTKQLEDLFNLPNNETFDDIKEPLPQIIKAAKKDALSTLDRINSALPTVSLDTDDNDLDALSELAKASYSDLVDLGMQVDSRSAGDILGIASQFLGHAITAKTAKMNKKLKMIDMQLKKAKLEADALKNSGDNNPAEGASGTIMDRNELLAELLKQQANK